MRHIFIINPAAGKRNATATIIEGAKALHKAHGISCDYILTKSPGHAARVSWQLASSGEPLRFYACGGDGTANEVANGILGFTNAAMTVVPTGTGNDLLKNFGPEMLPRFLDLHELWDAPTFPLDVIDAGERCALTIACNGIDAQIADSVHRYGAFFKGRSSYLASVAVNFLFRGIGHHWTVSLDGEEMEGEFALVSVCNGRHYGGGSTPVPEARMDDGVLETILVKKVTRTQFGRMFPDYSAGNYHKFPEIARVVTAKTITISSKTEDIVTCLDGECSRSSSVTLTLSPHKLSFFGPKGCDPNATATRKEAVCLL